jgi:hypothetical protein
MNTIILGDIHGSTFWKTAVAENPNCRYVFLGDYLDGKDDMVFAKEIANLQKIINFKKANPDNVILLLGNHDLMYIEYGESFFVDNLPLFQNAYQIDNIVFTHAGIVHKWFVEDFGGAVNRNIAAQLNNPSNRRQLNALRQVGDRYTDTIGGIFMAGVRELYEPLQGFTQIVGHNQVADIKDVTINGGRIIFCDCLWNGKYLRI